MFGLFLINLIKTMGLVLNKKQEMCGRTCKYIEICEVLKEIK